MSESNTLRWERGGDGVVVLTLADPGQSANTMHAGFRASLAATIGALASAAAGVLHGRRPAT